MKTSISRFVEEHISISTFDGLVLEGYLSKPSAEIRGIALLLSGSGPVGENGDVSSPFLGTGYRGKATPLNWQLRDRLIEEGIVTLRYAKRPRSSQSLSNLVADAKNALEILTNLFPDLPISLVGFSEGATIAALLASKTRVNSVHLLSPLVRPIDAMLDYQFLEWGPRLLSSQLDKDRDGWISASDLLHIDLTALPAVGVPTSTLPFDSKGRISIKDGIRPIYEAFYQQVRPLLDTPDFKAWYESFKEYGDPRKTLDRLTCRVFFYLRTFPNLGHAFAPMDGVIGEIRTSGPFDSGLLNRLAEDLRLSWDCLH